MKNHIENVILSIANQDMASEFKKLHPESEVAFNQNTIDEILKSMSDYLDEINIEIVQELMRLIKTITIDGEKMFYIEEKQFNDFLSYRLGI